jgi:hypothetical protein
MQILTLLIVLLLKTNIAGAAGGAAAEEDSVATFLNSYQERSYLIPQESLQNFYPEYFAEGNLNTRLLIEGLIREEGRANNLFRELFKLTIERNFDVNKNQLIANLGLNPRFAKKTMAHGIEDEKGGLATLNLILQTGKIKGDW